MNRLAVFSVMGHTILVFVGLLIYVLATRIGQQRRTPSAAIGWVVGIVAFPYVTLPLFLVFGTRKMTRPQHHTRGNNVPTPPGGPGWVTQFLESMELPPPVRNERLVWHDDGPDALKSLVAIIDSAERTLDLCTFILGNDEVGKLVADALLRAKQRGVTVRVLVDAVGSMKTLPRHLETLRAAGISVQRFMPFLHNPREGRINLRNHRKVTIADGVRMWSGGRNIAVEYFYDRPGEPAWVDLSHDATGAVAMQASTLFESDWRTASGEVRNASAPVAVPAPLVVAPQPPSPQPDTGPWAQWVSTGPDHADDTVHALLVAAGYHAKKRILAVTPYFVPDDALLDAWCMACRRGVDVNLIVPHQSNHVLADWARERSLRELCAAGAKVWLAPTMVHAKAVMVDDDLGLSGSLNLDARSLFLNYEVMTAFYSTEQLQWLASWFDRHMASATPYQAKRPGLFRDIGEGIVRSIGFQL